MHAVILLIFPLGLAFVVVLIVTAIRGNWGSAVTVQPGDAHGSAVTGFTVTCRSVDGTALTAAGPGPRVVVPGLRNNVDQRCSATDTNVVAPPSADRPCPAAPERCPR